MTGRLALQHHNSVDSFTSATKEKTITFHASTATLGSTVSDYFHHILTNRTQKSQNLHDVNCYQTNAPQRTFACAYMHSEDITGSDNLLPVASPRGRPEKGGKTKLKRIMQTLNNNKLHSENRSYNISNSHKYNPDQINTELLTN